MTVYQEIKLELSAKCDSTKYFNKQFLTDFLEAEKSFKANQERGIDNTYRVGNIRYTHEYDKIYTSEFYQKNGGTYCVFLEIMHQRRKKKEAYI